MASLVTYAPSSAMWWCFYDIYCGVLSNVSPIWVPRLVLQCVAAPLSGATTSLLTTPLDAIRARIQVENTQFFDTARALWREEHLGIFAKGLSARLVQSLSFSFFIILGYETIKRWSLLEEYKDAVRW
jgi:solute carrier family 25 protein 44